MIKFIYCVYDKKAQVYGNPFYSVSAAVALRDFGHAAKTAENQISMYAEDFSLWYFGSFDDQAGRMEFSEPQHVANAIDYKE